MDFWTLAGALCGAAFGAAFTLLARRTRVHVTVSMEPLEFLHRALSRLEKRMTEISDGLASLETEVGAAETRVRDDLAGLKQQITDLQNQVNAGTATPADIAKLAELKQRVANIDPAVPSPAP